MKAAAQNDTRQRLEVAGPAGEAVTAAPLSLPTLVLLAVGFRLTALFLIRYGGSAPDWSDFLYYHELASLSAQGFFPNIDFWVEYPPLFPWLAVAAFRLSLLVPPLTQPYFWFDLFLTVAIALADAGSIVTIDRLGDVFWGKPAGRRSATLYAALFLPAFAVLGWFDTLPVFFMLLALAAFVAAARSARSSWVIFGGLAVGIGVMFKLFPLLALPAALLVTTRDEDPATLRDRSRRFLLAGVLAGVTVLAIASPFLVLSREMFLATVRNVLSRGSWMSPWAILDGYYGTGGVASLRDRLFFPASAAWGQTVRDPWLWWIAAGFAVALVVWRGRASVAVGSPRAAISFVGFVLAMTLLLFRGFSQQFTVWLVPFVAIILPGFDGALLIVLLILDDLVLEGYLYVTLFPAQHRLLIGSVAIRTLLLVWFAVESAAAIDGKTTERFHRVRRALMRPAIGASVVGVVALVIFTAPSLASASIERSSDATVVAALRNLAPETAVVFTQPALYDRLYFATPPRRVVLVAEPGLLTWTGDRSLSRVLTSSLREARVVALVTDTSLGTSSVLPATRTWLGARYGAQPDKSFGSISVGQYSLASRAPENPLSATFGDSISLVGFTIGEARVHPGAPLNLTLHWHARSITQHDYSVSLQLLDASGALVSQHDSMPVDSTVPTSTWRPGDDVLDPISLALPPQLQPGIYQVIAVMYDHQSLQRLPAAGDDARGDHVVVGSVSLGP